MIKQWLKRIFSRWPPRGDAEPEHLATGRWGEAVAEDLLRRKGFRLIGRRVRIRKDEIDLIVQRGATLIFVEVKTRRSMDFGRPAASVTPAKQRKLCRAAVRYLKKRSPRPDYIRFDIVEVLGARDDASPQVEHIENAFPLGFGYRLPW